jgi:exosortase
MVAAELPRTTTKPRLAVAPLALTVIAFGLLFAKPFALLVRDWLNQPEAEHGLLLAPVAVWLAWRAGLHENVQPNRVLALMMLVPAVLIRYASDLAAELFTMRMSMMLALAALVVWHFGWRQILHWWLPFILLGLSVPLPQVVLNAITIPLQFTASKIGASLLMWREIPVMLTGNVIRIPGHELFVAEACSGLRSLTALLSLGVMLGGIVLRTPISRVMLIALAIPVAVAINGVRIFMTGFLMLFVDPKMGEGFMHLSEGWLMFVVAFAILGGLAWALGRGEDHYWPARPSAWRSKAVASNSGDLQHA